MKMNLSMNMSSNPGSYNPPEWHHEFLRNLSDMLAKDAYRAESLTGIRDIQKIVVKANWNSHPIVLVFSRKDDSVLTVVRSKNDTICEVNIADAEFIEKVRNAVGIKNGN